MPRARLPLIVAGCLLLVPLRPAGAQTATGTSRVLEFRYTPTARAQVALWIEKADGTFVKTIGLTQAVGYRGIGNRPGAQHMNSGFHWPYGRREGTLPIWAHRRAAASGAVQFSRVIFQDRSSEGDASRTTEDSTTERYFCLSFDSSKADKDQLDAVSCASGFNSDKGRYITSADVARGYSEPVDGSTSRPLDLVSLYPPRRDVVRCASQTGTVTPGCVDTADVDKYVPDATSAIPDIDAITMATAPGMDMEQSILLAVPDDWADGDYVAWAEVNTEGDSNSSYTFSTPVGDAWDSWAESYGYSYRGQPSVAFSVPFSLSASATASAAEPMGYGDVDGYGTSGGTLHPLDGTITDDPNGAPGSGADRFRSITGKGYRFQVSVRISTGTTPGTGGSSGSGGLNGAGGAGGGAGGGSTGATGTGGTTAGSGGAPAYDCANMPSLPDAPGGVTADHVADPKNSYQWGTLHFLVPNSVVPIHSYEVRVSPNPIDGNNSGMLAVSASLEGDALIVPITGAPGTAVDVNFGAPLGIIQPEGHYYVGVRAQNQCAQMGPFAVAQFTTTKINFTKLSGCFVATAAYGSALSSQVESLRVARDVLRKRSGVFATATDLYYRSGPAAAAVIARSDATRAVVRTLLGPLVDVATAAEAVTGSHR